MMVAYIKILMLILTYLCKLDQHGFAKPAMTYFLFGTGN